MMKSSGFTLVGHSTVLIKLGSTFILTDLTFQKELAPFSFGGSKE